MIFIRAISEGNFHLCLEALTKIIPWCFTLDHTNFTRWLSVHLSDMASLQKCHPDVYAEFIKGKFVVNNSEHAIALDQAHEQSNALVKGDGGAINLTSNSAALHRWMVSGPEMARLMRKIRSQLERPKH